MKSVTIILFIVISKTFAIAQNIMQQSQKGKDNMISINNNYTVTVADGDSRCQILINDVPLMYYEGSGERSFFANSAILHSGEQNIEIVTSGKVPAVTIVETKSTQREYSKVEIWKNDGALKGNFIADVSYNNIGWDKSRIVSNDSVIFKEAKSGSKIWVCF